MSFVEETNGDFEYGGCVFYIHIKKKCTLFSGWLEGRVEAERVESNLWRSVKYITDTIVATIYCFYGLNAPKLV